MFPDITHVSHFCHGRVKDRKDRKYEANTTADKKGLLNWNMQTAIFSNCIYCMFEVFFLRLPYSASFLHEKIFFYNFCVSDFCI